MKTTKFIFWGILSLYFQVLVSPKLAINGIEPNIFIAYIIFISINLSATPVLLISFFLGIAVDIFQPTMFGVHATTFVVISYLIVQLHKKIDKKQIIIISISVIFINFIYSLFILLDFLFQIEFSFNVFLNSFFTFLYNSLFSSILLYVYVFVDKLRISFYE